MADKKQIFTPVIKTERLVLRQWCEDDLEPFAKLNADPRVMEWFPFTLNRVESDDLAKRILSKLQEQGWGLWAVSIPDISSFIGFIGLAVPTFNAYFTPAVEVGWRLAYEYWGKGYATKGTLVDLEYGSDIMNKIEVVEYDPNWPELFEAEAERIK